MVTALMARRLAGDSARAAAAGRLRPDPDTGSSVTRLVALATRLLGVGSGQVSLLTDVQLVAAGHGLPDGSVGTEGRLEDSLCTLTTDLGDALSIPDASLDEQLLTLPPVASGMVRAYLGVPLRADSGHVVGSLCVFDPAPRAWTEDDARTLDLLGRAVSTELELASLTAEYGREQVRWSAAMDAGGVGSFDLSLADGVLTWDDRLIELFGYTDSADFGQRVEDFDARVHPDDRATAAGALQTAIETRGAYDVEYRIVLPSGELRWIQARGRTLCDPDGTAIRVVGAAYDTSDVHESAERTTRVLESMPSGFLSMDTEWRFTLINAAAEQLLGSPRGDLLGRSLWEAFPETAGNEFEAAYRAAVATGIPRTLEAYYPAPLDTWFEILCWPNPDGLSLYFADVTDRRRSADQAARATSRLALLAQVNADLVGAADVPAAVARLPRLLVPALAEGCMLTLVEGDGRPRDVGWWHTDPTRRAVLEKYVAARLDSMPVDSPLARVLQAGQPEHVSPATAAAVPLAGRAREQLDLLGEISADVLPIQGHEKVLGALTLFSSAGRRRDVDEETTAREIADRIGLALENARLTSAQAKLAEDLQRSLLTEPPQPDHGQIVVRYVPAAEAARVGGDWYDAFIQPGGSTMLVIGDVAGHDTAAAATMGQLRSLLRGIASYSDAGPVEVLRGLDAAMDLLQVGSLATAAVVRFEQSPDEVERGVTRMVWANAGHPPPLVVDPDGTPAVPASWRGDLLLGVDPTVQRREHVLSLDRGATVLLYTDGLIERRDSALDDGLERLVQVVTELAGSSLDELCDGVLDRMLAGRPEDDVALVAVRLHRQDRPRPAEAGPTVVPESVPDPPHPAQ
jgi:serine phosphatase RsbU (regulator of sigma subunit)/PAS domain-containing protein